MRFLRRVCALLLMSGCALASAQSGSTAASAPLSKGEVKAMRDFKLLDFNGDGKISRTEVALFPRLAAAFSDADTNHDNYLSYEEVRAYAVRYRAERDQERERQREQAAQAALVPSDTETEAGSGSEKKP